METHHFSAYIIMIAVLGYASSQNLADLGIFNIRFNIVLTNQHVVTTSTTSTTTTTTTTTTPAPTTTEARITSVMETGSETSAVSGPTSVALSTTAPPTTAQQTTTTAMQTTTTPQPPANTNISIQLHLKLAQTFSITTAYIATTKPKEISNTGSLLTYEYDVIYDKTLLNSLSYLHPNSLFISELNVATETILAWNMNFTDFYYVHDGYTGDEMRTTIAALSSDFSDALFLCAGTTCGSHDLVCMVDGNQVFCVEKCVEFEKTNNCTDDPSVDGVYLRGECKIDENGNAYCDCGMSSGDVMDNFFDGHQCVSVTFIVAMAACAGGFFFILLLIALCYICCRKGSRKHSSSRESSHADYTTYNGYNNQSHTGSVELNKRQHSVEYGSPKSRHRSSSSNSNAYDVTLEDTVEFKSIRL